MSDINITVRNRPPEDASDWERAMALADDLARSKHIGERQAKVFAALEVGVDRDEICNRLDMGESNSYQTYYDAEANVEHAEHIVEMLADHPALNPSKVVKSSVPMEEFDAEQDRFNSEVRHADSERLTDQQFVDDAGRLVTVQQPLGLTASNGVGGYLINRIRLSDGTVEELAVAADRLDQLIDEGQLTPATASVDI